MKIHQLLYLISKYNFFLLFKKNFRIILPTFLLKLSQQKKIPRDALKLQKLNNNPS